VQLQQLFGKPVDIFPEFVENAIGQFTGGISFTGEWEFYNKQFRDSVFETRALGAQVTFSGLQIPLLISYTERDHRLRFPFNFGNSFSKNFAYNLAIPTFGTIFVTGTRTVTADGWGQLELPLGTFDVLRVRTVLVTRFDVNELVETPFPLPAIPITQEIIQWWGKDQGVPLLEISGFSVLGQTAFTSVRFRDFDRRPVAAFSTLNEPEGCRPLTMLFDNTSQRADTYFWEFGDGFQSTVENPVYTYRRPGSFFPKLTVTNQFGTSTFTSPVPVFVKGPSADFSVSTTFLDKPGQMVAFTNRTLGGREYFWDFGDGYTSINLDPKHFYFSRGTYSVMLMAEDEAGCRDTLIKENLITVGLATSRNTAEAVQALQLYPNPATAHTTLQLDWAGQPSQLSAILVDAMGRNVQNWALGDVAPGRNTLQLAFGRDLAAGLYFLQLTDAQGTPLHRQSLQIVR
jgi:PKD repeat protein